MEDGFYLSFNELSPDEQALLLLKGVEFCDGSEEWKIFFVNKEEKNDYRRVSL